VDATDQVIAAHLTICQEGAAVGATAVETGKIAFCLTEARDDKVDILDQGMNGLIDFQFRELGERLAAHWSGNVED